jgi:hypothetical protein
MSAIAHLNDKERALLKAIIELFYEEVNGYPKKITSDQVLFRLAERGHDITDATFRRYLGLIRENNSCRKYLKKYKGQQDPWAFILSSNEGYWWSEETAEMRAFWESMHGRAIAILTNVKPLYILFGFSEEQIKILFQELPERDEKENAA